MPIIRSSPFEYPRWASVGDSNLDNTLPVSSTMPTAIFVPPISTAPITIFPSRHLVRSPVPRGVGLLLILGSSSFFTQQAVLVFDNERTITKGIAINSADLRQPFGRDLRGEDIDKILPVGRNGGAVGKQVPTPLGQSARLS